MGLAMDRIMRAFTPLPTLLGLLLAALFAAPASGGFQDSLAAGPAAVGENTARTALPVPKSLAVDPLFVSDQADETGPDDPPRLFDAVADLIRRPDTNPVRTADASARTRPAGPYQARAPPAA